VAGNAQGDAAVVFQGTRGLQIALARGGGPFGPARAVRGGKGGSAPNIALDERGNVLVLWSYFDNSQPYGPAEYRSYGCC
jgi:hypothetical protein